MRNIEKGNLRRSCLSFFFLKLQQCRELKEKDQGIESIELFEFPGSAISLVSRHLLKINQRINKQL